MRQAFTETECQWLRAFLKSAPHEMHPPAHGRNVSISVRMPALRVIRTDLYLLNLGGTTAVPSLFWDSAVFLF